MPLDKILLEKDLKATRLLIEKQPVNPWLVEIDLDGKGLSVKPIELHIGLVVLVFELQQCEVQVDEQSIRYFQKQPVLINDHGGKKAQSCIEISDDGVHGY